MKRIMALAATLLTAPVLAAECKPVEHYQVGKIAYRMRTAQESLNHLLRGTPYRGEVEGGPEISLKARRIAGPLARSLDDFAARTGTRWSQEGCRIRFAVAPPALKTGHAQPIPIVPQITLIPGAGTTAAQAVAPTWVLRPDTPIHLQFAEWARRAGWHFEWRLEKSWLVPAAAQFSGSFDEAIAQAVEGLYAQGKPVRLILWEGNRFAEIVDVDAK